MTKGETRSLVKRLGPGLAFTLLLLGAYFDPLFLSRNFAGRDLLPYNLPVERQVHDAYSRGRLPVWWEDVSGGRPLLPNPNVGALYPVRPLLSLLRFPLALRVFPILHWIAAGIGVMLLLSALGASPGAGFLAAVSYVFSGVGVSEVFYTNYHPGMTLLPWVAWATLRCRRAGGILLLAFLYGLDFLAGDVFTSGLAIGGSVLWILLEPPREERRPRGLALATALGLAALLAAPQIVASALWAPHTRRAVVGLKLDETLTFSLSPARLIELLIPYPFGATWSLDPQEIWGRLTFRDFFASLYAGAFAFIAAVVLARKKLPGVRWARSLLLACVFFATAPSLLPASWGVRSSPLPLRYPEKLSVGIVLALAVGAGLALDRFRGGAKPPRWILAVGALLALLAGAAWLFPARTGLLAASAVGAPSLSAPEAGRQLPLALAEAGLFWMAALVALEWLRIGARRTGGRGGVPVAAALSLLTLVPVLANRRVARTFPEEEVFSPTPFARSLSRRDAGAGARVLDESRYRPDSPLAAAGQSADPGGLDFYRRRWFFYTSSLWGRGTVFNTDPDVGDLSRMQSLREVSSFLASSEAGSSLFSTLALRFGIRFRDQEAVPGYRRFGGDALQAWDESPLARAPIRLLERWREEPGAIAALQDLPRLSVGEVAIETGRGGSGASSGGSLRVIESSPERLRLEAISSGPSWLFVLRGFWPYRTVLVDGRAAEVFPAHLAFSAVAVPAGRHRIDWREEFPGLEVSWLGPAAFVAIGAVLLGRDRRKPAAGFPPGKSR